MYLDHFGLRRAPFSLTPDTRFFFELGGHREALNTLLVALRSGEGFLKVVGEVGTGKTLLCRAVMNALGPGFVTAYLPNPLIGPSGLCRAVARELGVAVAEDCEPSACMFRIQEQLIALAARGRRAVLLIDEAQGLPTHSLETVRLLTNLETETHKLLQVVLFGQPELDERLARRSLRQLRQRITFSARLAPLDRAGTAEYVRYRLASAGYARGTLFSGSALARIHRASRGVPRRINVLCHKALLAAWGRGDAQVRWRHVRRAVGDTEDVAGPLRFARLAVVLLAAAGGLLGWGLLPG